MKKKIVSWILLVSVLLSMVAPVAVAAPIEKKAGLEAIVTAAVNSNMAGINNLADKLISESIKKSLANEDALIAFISPLIKDYLYGAVRQYLPPSLSNDMDIDSWVNSFMSREFIKKVAGEVAKSDLFAKTLSYASADLLKAINISAIKEGAIKSCVDNIWNQGNPSSAYYSNNSWRVTAINLYVAAHMTSQAVTKLTSVYDAMNINAILRGAASRALNEAINSKKADVEKLLKDKTSELEIVIKRLISEAKLSASNELIKSFNAIFSSIQDYNPLTISDTIQQAIVKAEYNAGLVGSADRDAALVKLSAMLANRNLDKCPDFRKVIQAAIDIINKAKLPKLSRVTDSAVGVSGETSKVTAGGVPVITITYDVTGKTGVIKLAPRFEITETPDQSLLKIRYQGLSREYYKAGDNLYQVSDNAAVLINRNDIPQGGSVKVEFAVMYNDILIGKYIAALNVRKDALKKHDDDRRNDDKDDDRDDDRDDERRDDRKDEKRDDAKKETAPRNITISGVENGNKQSNINFNIVSANGKGYSVYLSESGSSGSFKLYSDVNYNSKGAHVKGLKNGVTYYAYIMYDNALKSGTVQLRPEK